MNKILSRTFSCSAILYCSGVLVLGFGVWGFRVWVLGFRGVQGLGLQSGACFFAMTFSMIAQGSAGFLKFVVFTGLQMQVFG